MGPHEKCRSCQEIIRRLHVQEEGDKIYCSECGRLYRKGAREVLDGDGTTVSEGPQEMISQCSKCGWIGKDDEAVHVKGAYPPFRCPSCNSRVYNRQDKADRTVKSANRPRRTRSQADAVRDLILERLDAGERKEVLDEHWHPMKRYFGERFDAHFDRFMRDYLVIELGYLPMKVNILDEFKGLVENERERSVKEIVSAIHQCSEIYCQLAFVSVEDRDLEAAIEGINKLEAEVAYPFLMMALNDHYAGLIARSDMLKVFRIIESYILRRYVCGLPTNTLNRTFAMLLGSIRPESYVESVMVAIASLGASRRMPGNEEFHRGFETGETCYTGTVGLILDRLENHGRREMIDISNYAVEHIMPERELLSQEWRKELGKNWRHIHEMYYHTIGNLTLVTYGPELGSSGFRGKQEMEGGFRDSPLRLNSGLAGLDRWDEKAIKNRASELSKLACEIWPCPSPGA